MRAEQAAQAGDRARRSKTTAASLALLLLSASASAAQAQQMDLTLKDTGPATLYTRTYQFHSLADLTNFANAAINGKLETLPGTNDCLQSPDYVPRQVSSTC